MATVISGQFQIVTDLAAGTGTTNLATSRAMRVVSIQATGLNNATVTVSKISAAGVATQMGVVLMESAGLGVSLSDQYAVMDIQANCTMLDTDTIRIVRAAQNSTRCVITAVAAAGSAITES
jgi:hypothetical protein